MSQAFELNTEPLKWPIAPDGYIPNSVIRGWLSRLRGPHKDRRDDVFCSLGEWTTDEEEDLSTRVMWLLLDDEDEEEEEEEEEEDEWIADMRRRRREREEKQREQKMEVEGKEKVDKKKEMEEKPVLVKRSHNIQTLQNLQRTSDGGRVDVKPQEVDSAPRPRTTVSFLRTTVTTSHTKVPLRELNEDTKLPEVVVAPVQFPPAPDEQTRPGLIKGQRSTSRITDNHFWNSDQPKLPEPRSRTLVPENLTPPLQDLPSSQTPKDPPRRQPDLRPPERTQIKDKRFLLYSAKYDRRDQAQAPIDRRVIEMYRKVCRKRLQKLDARTKSGSVNLTRGHLQTLKGPIKECRSCKCMPDRRKNLYGVFSLQDYCTEASHADAQPPLRTSSAAAAAASVASLQPGAAATHQRVVQKIHMTDTSEPPSSHFHPVIPMAAQHSFLTLNPSGETKYGRLQFDWTRGSEEDATLKVSGVHLKARVHRVR